MKPNEAIARWTPRIDWPEIDDRQLTQDALDHVREHRASVAFERHIPEHEIRCGSNCPRKAVINLVRVEHSNYEALIDRYPRLREAARIKVNQVIGQHYQCIKCTCRRCP